MVNNTRLVIKLSPCQHSNAGAGGYRLAGSLAPREGRIFKT